MNGSVKENCENEHDNVDKVRDFKVSDYGCRHQQCLILLITFTLACSMRACMGVALVGMTANNTDTHANKTEGIYSDNETVIDTLNVNAENYIADGFLNVLMLTPPYPQFDWNKKIQDVIISSFFFGYMLLQIPAGQLAHRFGSKSLLTIAMGTNCIISLLFPLLSFYGGWKLSCVCRAIQGLSQACIVPSIHTFLGKWTPLEERGRLSALIYGGQALGAVLGLLVSGFIAASPLGWPGLFRFYGVLAGMNGCVIFWMSADSPAQHPKISDGEREYIQQALDQTNKNTKKIPVPWSRMLRSRGLYAIIVAHIGQTWGAITLYSEVPAYMNKVMGVNIKTNGLLTALPFLVMWIMNFIFSWFFDMLIVKKYVTVIWSRKLANTVACVTASLGLIILAYSSGNIYFVETLLIIICGFKTATHVGFMVNHIDISPNFAGTMMSLSNFTSHFFAFFAPILAGFILTDDTDEHLWRKVFFVSSGFYFFTNLVFLLFGTSDLADWNEPKSEDDKHDLEADPMLPEAKTKNTDA